MLNTKVGWKITTTHRYERDGSSHEDLEEIMIVYSKIDARMTLSGMIHTRGAVYETSPFRYERSFYESDDKVQIAFKTYDRKDMFFIEATKIDFAEVG